MATAPEQITEGEQPDPNAEPNAAPVEGEEKQENPEDSPYADLAKEMGWVPKDQFNGNPDDWKSPEDFIRAGRDIQRETSRELKSVRSQLDTIAKTSASIVEQQVRERVDELTAKYSKAVEDGDATEAFKLASDIQALKTQGSSPATRQASPEAQAFAERNASWFNKPGHEYATARAVEITNMLAGQGYTDHGTQLRIAEQRLRQEMPELFGGKPMNGKPPAGVNQPSSRTSGASNRQKGFSDLPPEAQKIAADMADRGVIKSKDDYAKNYFANLATKG